jgi:hypothetical protein
MFGWPIGALRAATTSSNGFRDYSSRRTWVHKVLFHTNHVYVHLMLEFAKSGLVPAHLHEYFQTESLT